MHAAIYGNCSEKSIHGMIWCATVILILAHTFCLVCLRREPKSPWYSHSLAFSLREPQFAQRKVFDALCSLLLCQNIVIARLFCAPFTFHP